jgi:anti-anti-sigma factor
METININHINKEKRETFVEVSLDSINRLTVLNTSVIKASLLKLVSNKNTKVFLSLRGLTFIDSTGFDCLNQISRVARQYRSNVILIEVEPELMELINLVRQYSIFDIQEVVPAQRKGKVA